MRIHGHKQMLYSSCYLHCNNMTLPCCILLFSFGDLEGWLTITFLSHLFSFEAQSIIFFFCDATDLQ